MKPTIEQMKTAYNKHRHLKNAAEELGMKWQTLYWNLSKVGHPVVGNKSKYGSDTDKLASRAEKDFLNLVPYATDMNRKKFQSKYDFLVHGLKVDVKASTLKRTSKDGKINRYVFCIKKQEMIADFIVAFGYKDDKLSKCYLFPKEMIRHMTSISVSSSDGKWSAYEIDFSELKPFFDNYHNSESAELS